MRAQTRAAAVMLAASLLSTLSCGGVPHVGDSCRASDLPRCDGQSLLLTCEQGRWASTVCYEGAGCLMAGSVGACDVPFDPVFSVDAGPHPVLDVYPAPHPPLPTVVTAGGPVLRHPRVVPITFASDPAGTASGVDAFCAGLGATEYWKAATEEYGVSALSSARPVHLTQPAPASVDTPGVEALLAGLLDGGVVGIEAPTADTVYAFVFPHTTTVMGSFLQGCVDFGGYHTNTLGPGPMLPYIVVAQCPGSSLPLDSATETLSHELIEAATDPFPFGAPAYWRADDGNAAWTLYTYGEVTDLCEFEADVYFKPAEFPFQVARSWSNRAGAEGKNPCVPATPGSVYFAAVVEQPDTVTFSHFGEPATGRGIRIPVGGSRTVKVYLFSESKTYDWSVWASADGTDGLDLSLDRDVGNNGDVFNLTITVKSVDPRYDAEVFVLRSSALIGTDAHYTYGLVSQ